MKSTEVKVVLLQGGVEVVADVEVIDLRMRLHRPMKMVPVPIPMQTPQGINCQFLMQMIPLLPSSGSPMLDVWARDCIGEPQDPMPQVKDLYLQLTTGIQIAH